MPIVVKQGQTPAGMAAAGLLQGQRATATRQLGIWQQQQQEQARALLEASRQQAAGERQKEALQYRTREREAGEQFQTAQAELKRHQDEAAELDKFANENLTPEGLRNYQALQKMRPSMDSAGKLLRPEQVLPLWREYAENIRQARLDQKRYPRQTMEEWYEDMTFRDKAGTLIGKDRNNRPRVLPEKGPAVDLPQAIRIVQANDANDPKYMATPRSMDETIEEARRVADRINGTQAQRAAAGGGQRPAPAKPAAGVTSPSQAAPQAAPPPQEAPSQVAVPQQEAPQQAAPKPTTPPPQATQQPTPQPAPQQTTPPSQAAPKPAAGAAMTLESAQSLVAEATKNPDAFSDPEKADAVAAALAVMDRQKQPSPPSGDIGGSISAARQGLPAPGAGGTQSASTPAQQPPATKAPASVMQNLPPRPGYQRVSMPDGTTTEIPYSWSPRKLEITRMAMKVQDLGRDLTPEEEKRFYQIVLYEPTVLEDPRVEATKSLISAKYGTSMKWK